MKARIVTLLMMLSLGVKAQDVQLRPWEVYLNEVMTLEDVESASLETVYDLLCELEQHPLDINSLTRETLEQFPFLSAQQIEEIIEYRDRYGPLKSVGELQMVRSLDYAQRRLLSYFIYIGDEQERGFPKLDDIARYGRHELMATTRIPFYRRKGDDGTYLGDPYRHWLRYQFTYHDAVKAGFVGAKDAGEPFFTGRNRWGYDHYAFYLQLRGLGRLESLCLGHYRISMGMGLVMNSDFSLGKVAMLQNLGRASTGLRAHSSRSDNFLQGAAATLNLGKGLRLTAFGSYRAIDATLNKDGTAATLLNTGYHRTAAEMDKKHNLNMMKAGGNLSYQYEGLHIGLNMAYSQLSRELKPNTSALYRKNYPQGKDFLNTSLDYRYASHRLSLSGETAIDKAGHLATINTASIRLGDTWSMMALQRFYAYSYASIDAQSFSEGGRVQNESGVYLGLTWQPSPSLRLDAYTDFAYFAWARYQVSQSSYNWDHLLQGTWQHRGWTLDARYRLRRKQKDNADKTALDSHPEHRLRLGLSYAGEGGFGTHTQIDGGYYAYGEKEWGMMISQSLSYESRRLRLNGGVGYFHTDSYDSRVYLYEKGPLYTYGLASFYGEGIRYWLMARAAVGQKLTLTAKIGVTDYFDRSTIGSSYQQIDASSMTDMDLQVRWKF